MITEEYRCPLSGASPAAPPDDTPARVKELEAANAGMIAAMEEAVEKLTARHGFRFGPGLGVGILRAAIRKYKGDAHDAPPG